MRRPSRQKTLIDEEIGYFAANGAVVEPPGETSAVSLTVDGTEISPSIHRLRVRIDTEDGCRFRAGE